MTDDDNDLVRVGDRVKLVYTSDRFTKLKPGDCGRVVDITKLPEYLSPNPQYQIWISWDNGSKLAMCPPRDIVQVISK